MNGIAGVLATQIHNGTLARFPDAVRELAVYALATGTFAFFSATLAFAPQLTTVYARSDHALRTTLAYLLLTAAGLAAVLVVLGFTPASALLQLAYGIDTAVLEQVLAYLRWLAPMVVLWALRFFLIGLLVQAERTGWVTLLNVLYLVATGVILVIGFQLGWSATATVLTANYAAEGVQVIGLAIVAMRLYRLPAEREHEDLDFRELTRFFVPVTTTGVMFAFSRPVLYAFVGRTPEALPAIAALRVGFDFSFIFQAAANQFRHFFVTFGMDDLVGKRRFMAVVCVALTLLMLAVCATPLSTLVLEHGLGIRGEVLERSVAVLLVMCGMPLVIITRNYFHGLLMVNRRTGGMAWAGILRVVGMALAAWALLLAGWLDHTTAAATLLLGFAIETGCVVLSWRSVRRAL